MFRPFIRRTLGRVVLLAAVVALPATGVAVTAAAPSASAQAYNCQARTGTITPFAQWGDTNQYFTLMGGQFETSPTNYGWGLTGGASVVSGNEPWKVVSSTDSRSLRLPAGATANPDDFCIYPNEPSLRFFADAPGVPGSTLTVSISAIFTNGKGGLVAPIETDVAYQLSGSVAGWAPTPAFAIPQSPASVETAVLVKVTANGGAWQIDDFEVDPWKSR